jgi:hypothetical protein
MGLIIQKSDFVGKYSISQNTYSNLDNYINKYEELYLINLLGVELFKLFKLDVVNHSPVTQKYLDIFNTIKEDDTNCNSIRISEGIKEMLLGFVYFEYLKDDKYKPTPSGTVASESENSRETGFEENGIYNRYNNSIKSYNTIQWFIEKDINNNYPLYNGQPKELATWI